MNLRGKTKKELDSIFRKGQVIFPKGEYKGRVYIGLIGKIFEKIWHGKIFYDDRLINSFFGLRIIKARVYKGSSKLDNRESVILDYSINPLLFPVYDEVRLVDKNQYLGRLIIFRCFILYFGMDK